MMKGLRDRLLNVPQSGFLWAVILAVVAVLGAVVILVVGTLRVPLVAPKDQATWVGNEIAIGILALAAIAAVVAIAAYAVSLRRPLLEPDIKFRYSDWNKPALAAEEQEREGRRPLILQIVRGHQSVYTRQGEADVRIHNRVRWSARNPALRVELIDMGLLRENPGWRTDKQNSARGIYSVIWEGGSDRPIHGEWTVNLPPLNFAEVALTGPNPAITLDVVAEGFHSVKRLMVATLTREELAKRMTTYGDDRSVP